MANLYVLGTILFAVIGQVFIKKYIGRHGPMPEGVMEKTVFFFHVLLDPYIILGFLLAFVSAIFWLAAMTKLNLTQAYPLLIAGLVVTNVLAAVLVLRESLDAFKIAGIALIILGTLLMNRQSIMGMLS